MSDMVPQSEMTVQAPPVLEAAPPPAAVTPEQSSLAQRVATRMWCAFTFGTCAAMLGLALYLTPDARGLETHRQLHLPPCGFYFTTGLPCPTCGCTTAVTWFAHGHWWQSLVTQPFGFAVGVLALLLLPLTLVGMVSGRWLGPSMFTLQWYWRVWVYGGLLLLGVAWIYKIIMVKYGAPPG